MDPAIDAALEKQNQDPIFARLKQSVGIACPDFNRARLLPRQRGDRLACSDEPTVT